MALNVDDPTVPAECTDSVITKDVTANDCYKAELNFGPTAVNLYYAKPGNPFAALPTALEINRRLALADSDAEQLIGPIVCVVTRSPTDATNNTIRINGEDYETSSTSTYNVTFNDTKDANHTMMRQTQAGGVKGHWYGVDQNNNWRGGQNGMCGGKATLKLRENNPEGETDPHTFVGTLSGKSKYDDARMDSPVPVLFGGS